MNEKQFSDRIGNVNDKLVQQAEQTPNYGREHRKRGIRQLVAIAATIALMVCSFTVGALAFAEETIVEVPVEQETITIEEIGWILVSKEILSFKIPCAPHTRSVHPACRAVS